MESSLLFWGFTLIVGLPILTVSLEEAIKYLERQGNPLARACCTTPKPLAINTLSGIYS